MKDLLRIASLLDNYEQFRLSDKLFKIAQENQKLNTTDGRENVEDFAPSSKNDAQWQADKGTYQRFMLMNTNTPENFIKSLFEFSKQNKINNLVQAFDAYANAGASYDGNLVNRDPVLKELYMRVRNTPRMIPEQELVNEIKMLSNPQGTMTTPNENMSFEQLQKSLKLQPSNLLQEYKPIIDSDTLLTDQQKDFLYKIIDSSSQKTQKA